MDSNELSSAPAPASAGQKYQKVKNSNPWGWQFLLSRTEFLLQLRQISESGVQRSLVMSEVIRNMSRKKKSLFLSKMVSVLKTGFLTCWRSSEYLIKCWSELRQRLELGILLEPGPGGPGGSFRAGPDTCTCPHTSTEHTTDPGRRHGWSVPDKSNIVWTQQLWRSCQPHTNMGQHSHIQCIAPCSVWATIPPCRLAGPVASVCLARLSELGPSRRGPGQWEAGTEIFWGQRDNLWWPDLATQDTF